MTSDFHLIGNFLCNKSDDNLHICIVQADHATGTQASCQRFVDQCCVFNSQAQAGNAGINRGQIIGAANRRNVLAGQRGYTLLFIVANIYIFTISSASGNGEFTTWGSD